MQQAYSLQFEGYWPEPNISGLPTVSGVYCVYACTKNPDGTVSISRLIYIGEAGNVQERVTNHEKWTKWRRYLKPGEELCFSAAHVAASDRQRIEAAMIYQHKPSANEEYVDNFPFDTTTIRLSGTIALLAPSFTVKRTDESSIASPFG